MSAKLDHILAEMAQGHSLNAICDEQKDFDYPSESTVRSWVLNDTPAGFAARYARARELQYDAWADQIVKHADRPLIGVRRKTTADGVEETEGDNVERAKLMVDSRKWLLSKLAPKKYGEHSTQEITGANGGPLTISWLPAPPK
jgi:hypothetical protein